MFYRLTDQANGKCLVEVHDEEKVYVSREVATRDAALVLLKKADEEGWMAINNQGEPMEPVGDYSAG